MARKQLQNMQLPETGYNPVIFQGYTAEGPQYNANILANSIGRLDEAIEKTSDKQGAMNLALGEIRSQLNPNEYEWFDNYTKEHYINPLQAEIDAGNFGSAITLATRLGTEAPGNFEFQDRERVNKQFNTWKEELKVRNQRGEIDDLTYRRALALNDYKYTPVYNTQGENVGGYNWEAAFNPVKDISLNEFMERLQKFKGVSSETTSYKGGTTQDFYKANGENAAVKSTKTGGSKTESTTGVEAEEWEAAFDNYLKSNAGSEDALALQQKYDNALYLYEEKLKEATDTSLSEEKRNIAAKEAENLKKDITDEEGGLLSADTYIRKIAQPMFNLMSYKKHTLATEAGDTLVDKSTLANRAYAKSIFGNNQAAIDLYTLGYSVQYIQSNAEDRKKLTSEGKAMRNEFSSNIVE